MAEKIVAINLDKERHLKFNLNALILAEQTTGKKMSDLGKEKNGFDLSYLRAMIYAGLKWEDKKLKIEEVGEMIDVDNLSEVSKKLEEAMKGLK